MGKAPGQPPLSLATSINMQPPYHLVSEMLGSTRICPNFHRLLQVDGTTFNVVDPSCDVGNAPSSSASTMSTL
jgi:hypothetical protein